MYLQHTIKELTSIIYFEQCKIWFFYLHFTLYTNLQSKYWHEILYTYVPQQGLLLASIYTNKIHKYGIHFPFSIFEKYMYHY